MAKIIRQPDIYDINLYAPLIKDTKTLLDLYEKLGKVLKEDAAQLIKVIQGLDTKTAAGIQKLNALEQQSQRIVSARNKLDNDSVKIKKQLLARTDEEVKAKLKLQKLDREQRAILKDRLVLEDKEAGTLEKLNAKNRILRRERAAINLETREGQQAVKAINAQIDRNNKLILANSDALKKDRMQVGGYKRALEGVRGVLGQIGLAFGAFAVARDVFNIGVEFEKSIASLSAITGATGETLEQFKANVLDVASTTKKGASEVAKAFELVGSAKPELLADADALAQVTEQAIILSQATGIELEGTVKALTGTLNQFNLGADESSRIINILAAGSQAGAAPVDQITESLEKFGTVANAVNVSVEESIGAIEVLAEKNITGAESGTKLRNVLTTLSTIDALPEKAQEQLEKYGVNTAIVSDQSLSLSDRLRELSKIADDQTALFRVFGKENLVAGQILLQNADSLDSYTQAVTGTNVATEQAATNQNTLSAILDQLRAAWEAVVLKFTEGTGGLDILKTVLKFVADNLETLINIVFAGIRAWAAYQIQVKLLGSEFSKLNVGEVIRNFGNLIRNIPNLVSGFRLSAISARGLGNAIKSIPFVKVVSALAAIGPPLFDFVRGLFQAEEEVSALDRATEKINENLAKEQAQLDSLFEQLKRTNAGSTERADLIDAINGKYGTTLQNLEDEAEFVNQVNLAYEQLNAQLERRITQQIIEQELATLFAQKRELEQGLKAIAEGGDLPEEVQTAIGLLGEEFVKLESQNKLDKVQKDIEELFAELNGLEPLDLDETIFGGLDDEEDGTGGGKGTTTKDKFKTDAELRKQEFEDIKKQNAENLKVLENEAIKRGDSQEMINKMLAEQRLRNLQIENDASLRLFGEFSEEFLNANLALNKELAKQNVQAKTDEEARKKQEFQDIKNQNEENLKILESSLIAQGKSREDIEKALNEQRLENLKSEADAALRLFGENSQEFIDANLALNRELLKQDEEAAKKRLEAQKEVFERAKELFGEFADLLEKTIDRSIDKIDERIKRLDDEISASKDREEELKRFAEERNLNADESIKAERERQKKALNEQQELQRKKEEVEVFLTVLKAFAAKIESGDINALANVKSDLNNLKSFASGLTGFYEGTNTTLGDSLGYSYIPGDRDTHIIKAHKDEMILGVNNSNKLKGMTQDEVTTGALMYKNGLLYTAMGMNQYYTQDIAGISAPFDNGMGEKMDVLIGKIDQLPKNMPSLEGAYNWIADYIEFNERRKGMNIKTRIKGR